MEINPSKAQTNNSKGLSANASSNEPSKTISGSNTVSPAQATVSSISELKLTPNKEYPAEVAHRRQNSNTPNELVNKLSLSGTGNDVNQSKKESHWLIKVNDKFIDVKTHLPLETLQKLTIKIISDANGRLSLSTSTFPSQGLPDTKATTLSSSGTIGPTAINTSLPGEIQQTLNGALLKQLSTLLTEQVSLQKGFALINDKILHSPLSNSSNLPSNNLSNNAQTIRHLLNLLPQARDFIGTINTTSSSSSDSLNLPRGHQSTTNTLSGNTSSTQGANQSHTELSPFALKIKQLLLNSGIFLERADKQATSPLLSYLSNAAQKISSGYVSQPPQNQGIGIQSEQRAHAMLSILEKLQQLIDSKTNPLQGSQNIGDALASSTSSLTASTPALLDLKLNLLKTIISLTQHKNSKEQAGPLDTLSIVDETLSRHPFDFPKINSEAKSKANAILADKELSTGQLLKLMAAMLNRIQFNQLNSIYQSQQGDNTTQSLFFEIPLLNTQGETDVISLRIDQKGEEDAKENSEEKQKELQWKIGLTFDLEGLGPLFIQILLMPPSVSSIIWVEKPATFALVQQETALLKQKLGDIGLEVGDINCQQGLPDHNNTRIDQNLVDIEA